jgi:hypothetical protein
MAQPFAQFAPQRGDIERASAPRVLLALFVSAGACRQFVYGP